MTCRLTLSLLAGLALLGAGTPPDRPEKLVFKPLAFTFPRASAFKATLRNGIPLYIHAEPEGVPFVRLRVMFRGGSFLVPPGKEGLASLYGTLLRDGGTERMSPDALDERLEFLAASIRGGCGDTSGVLSMQVMAKDLAEGMDLFMQVLTRPAFSPDRLDLARKSFRQGLEARNDAVESVAQYQMSCLLNGTRHFSTAFPTGASLDRITREDLQAFHARLLHPENLVVVASGCFERKAMVSLLDRTLGSLKPGNGAQPSSGVLAPSHVRRPGIYVVDKEVPQSLVQMALPGLRRTDPDWHAAYVMNQILGGSGFTARLMKKIRSDEGLTYGIGSQFGEGPYWRGNWSCGFQTKNRSVAYSLRLAFEEIARMKREPVSDTELEDMKEAIVQAFPGEWSNRGAVAVAAAQARLVGWPEDWHADFRERIRAVTREDILRVAKTYLDLDQLVVLVVGKASEVEAGDPKDHPGLLRELCGLPLVRLPLRDPLTMQELR